MLLLEAKMNDDLTLEQLNEQIKAKEKDILAKKNELNELKQNKDRLVLDKATELEKKYKETKDPMISNQAKRENYVVQEEDVKSMLKQVENKETEIKVMEIELRADVRDFNIKLAEKYRNTGGRPLE